MRDYFKMRKKGKDEKIEIEKLYKPVTLGIFLGFFSNEVFRAISYRLGILVLIISVFLTFYLIIREKENE